ncbi:helix-turn-helix domain-containing protein [Streptomyces sp. NPDC002265]|uniref:helix-turn-helix domain-containing protein n=1 Tax=Streptomyces sp. NPDC002265 TaxID=3154415 RepID=UPI003320E222
MGLQAGGEPNPMVVTWGVADSGPAEPDTAVLRAAARSVGRAGPSEAGRCSYRPVFCCPMPCRPASIGLTRVSVNTPCRTSVTKTRSLYVTKAPCRPVSVSGTSSSARVRRVAVMRLRYRFRLYPDTGQQTALAKAFSSQILRDCRLRGDGVHQAMLGIARLHNLTVTG